MASVTFKIAFYNLTTTTKVGGIETFNWGMARALAARGHTVHLYGGREKGAPQESRGVPVFTYPYLRREWVPNLGSRFRKFGERLSFGWGAFGDLIKREYDYLYISKPYDLPVALSVVSRSRAKLIFGAGGTEFFPGYRSLVRRVDYFFACSAFNAAQIEEYCGIRPRVLPNGIDTDLFRSMTPDRALRSRLKIAEGEKVVVSVCRLVGWKGIQYAIKAVSKLVRQKYPIRYLIVGEGEYRKDLEALAENLDLKDQVSFLGGVKNADLPRYYSLADVAVFPSIADETFGISIAEAMACGVPVISTQVGGIPEVVAEGTGILVPPRDDQALAKAMTQAIFDETSRGKIGAAGRRWVVEQFGWDRVARKFEAYLHPESHPILTNSQGEK